MLGNCKILQYNAFYSCVVRENAYGIHSPTMRHQHLALVATRLGPDVGDLCQMRPCGTRMNAICIYSGTCNVNFVDDRRSVVDFLNNTIPQIYSGPLV